MTGVISRAGLDGDLQAGQIEAAIRFKIDKVLAYKAKIDQADGSPVEIRIGDVVTSEYGVGLLADHAVHGGEWGAMKAARDGLRAYVAANPDIDLSRPSDWASDAEPEMWDTITAGWTDRAASLEKNGCSQDAGSFVR